MHYRRRTYDPRTGRFLQKDPMGMPEGTNRYVYVSNDPVNAVDPWGLSGLPEGVKREDLDPLYREKDNKCVYFRHKTTGQVYQFTRIMGYKVEGRPDELIEPDELTSEDVIKEIVWDPHSCVVLDAATSNTVLIKYYSARISQKLFTEQDRILFESIHGIYGSDTLERIFNRMSEGKSLAEAVGEEAKDPWFWASAILGGKGDKLKKALGVVEDVDDPIRKALLKSQSLAKMIDDAPGHIRSDVKRFFKKSISEQKEDYRKFLKETLLPHRAKKLPNQPFAELERTEEKRSWFRSILRERGVDVDAIEKEVVEGLRK